MTSLECFGKGWLLVTLALSFLTRPCVLSAKSKMKDSLGMKGSACLGSGMVSGALVPKGYCAQIYAEQLSKPRGLFFLDKARILIVEAGKGQITLLEDRNGNGRIDPSEHRVIASAPGLNHGLFVRSGYVYASSSTAVYRWKFLPKGMKIKFLKKELVIRGIPGGGHWTRTLVFDKSDNLYVSIGSAGNVDPDSSRSRVVRFTKQQLKKLPQAWARGEVFADGLRNEVGLAFDSRGRLWGVENGLDNLYRKDLGGDIHNDNPGEELNLLTGGGKFYGYPQCWSEYLLEKRFSIPGRQWVHEKFRSRYDDAWCRNPKNVIQPKYVLPAHTAPLGLAFYPHSGKEASWRGHALVALHGSWNRDIPVGYKLVRIPFVEGNPRQVTAVDMFAANPKKGGLSSWPYRPVDVRVRRSGEIFFSSDRSGHLLRLIAHKGR